MIGACLSTRALAALPPEVHALPSLNNRATLWYNLPFLDGAKVTLSKSISPYLASLGSGVKSRGDRVGPK